MSRVLICGSRTFSRRDAVEEVVATLPSDSVVINGAAPGADSLGAACARLAGFEVETYPADWGQHGRRAGFVRNQQMLDEGKPDVVYAFVDKPLTESRGTAMMVKIAQDAGVPVKVIERLP